MDLTKENLLLTGKERARLIIKDAHEKALGNKKGFLTDAEREALIRIPDSATSREYGRFWELYQNTPLIMGIATETYLRFKYLYEVLKKIHMLLKLNPALERLSCIIRQEISKKKKLKEGLALLDSLRILEPTEGAGGKLRWKEGFQGNIILKENVQQVYGVACNFFAIKKLIDKINKELNFNVFAGKPFAEQYPQYVKEVSRLIKEHNKVIRATLGNLENTEDYLILKPKYKTAFYNQWKDYLFK